MEYEKKYKEANDKVAARFGTNVAKEIFTDLYESEDEKMMHQLHSWMKEFGGAEEYTEKVYTWLKSLLEKQGELIDKLVKYREWLISKTEQWTERKNDKTNSNAGEHCCIGAANALISARAEFEEIFDYESWFEKQGEKKPIEEINGEDYGIDSLYHAQRILEETLGSVDGYQSDDGILDHKAAITAVKKLYKQKPWSEEDKDYFDAIITKLEVTQEDAALTDNQLKFLKSLKYRVLPQNTWKPSDKQMEALYEETQKSDRIRDDRIVSLYNDLKKLREE